MEKKNRPEMQAANQYREKSDFKPASAKTPVIAASVNPGFCSDYPTISRLTYENFVGEESTYTKSAGQPFGSMACWLADAENFSLPYSENACYLLPVAAKSVTGIETPCKLVATPDALRYCVFFCVKTSVQPFTAAMIRIESMVALSGQPSGWPVSISAGSLNPVSVTALLEIETSGGDSLIKLMEFIAMMTIPTQSHPNFRFRFLALCATGSAIVHIVAPSERAAREMSPAGFVMVFAGRLPAESMVTNQGATNMITPFNRGDISTVQEVRHA